jgi:protein phosphatase 1 regulatory subunit 37
MSVTNVVWFQRIDLRDNCVKLAGLMALALSLKVNTSVTQLDLDDVPKKKMVNITIAHCVLKLALQGQLLVSLSCWCAT